MNHVLASAGSSAAATSQSIIFWLLAVVSVGSAIGTSGVPAMIKTAPPR